MIAGAPVSRGDDLPPEARTFVVPVEDVTVHLDSWHVAGLKGTGSCDFSFDDVFVPAHRRVSIMDIATGQTPGMKELQIPMGRLPFGWPAIWGSRCGRGRSIRVSEPSRPQV